MVELRVCGSLTSISEVAREYRVARSWIYILLARYRAEGQAGLGPRSRRPTSYPRELPANLSKISRTCADWDRTEPIRILTREGYRIPEQNCG